MSDALERLEALREAAELKRLGARPKTAGGQSEATEAIFAKGVSVSFLCKVFRMSPSTVREKLAKCTPIPGSGNDGSGKQQSFRYDLAEAASYLVKPSLTTDQVLAAMKSSDLPPSIQQQFWNAQLRRQEWEERAGELWRTDKVREVLGTTFQTMKFTMQLWIDSIELKTKVTDKQREVLQELVDGLQREIYKALVDNATLTRTEPLSAENPANEEKPRSGQDLADDLI